MHLVIINCDHENCMHLALRIRSRSVWAARGKAKERGWAWDGKKDWCPNHAKEAEKKDD